MNALKEAFTRAGYATYATNRPAEAEDLLSKKPIGTIFVDCLLPEISGVEFTEQLRKKFPAGTLDVILMSGFFTDPSFIKESLRSTQGKHFLKKPFQLQDALSLVDPLETQLVSEVQMHPRKALYMLFNKGKVTAREKKKAIESLDDIHGFDLPFIYSLLVESQASGHLNVATMDGVVYGISLAHGYIIHVDVPDKKTYLGRLLLEGGYVHPEDLENITNDTKTNMKIGERLTSSFAVSPHAINIALAQQMNIRLSRTIVDQKVVVNFVESEMETKVPNIDPESFFSFLHDWMASKITLPWLKNHYIQWSRARFIKTPIYQKDHAALESPLVQAMSGLNEELVSGKTFDEILESKKFAEEPLYKAIHYLLTRGLFVLKEDSSNISSQDRTKYLKKLLAQLSAVNEFDVFETMAEMLSVSDSDPEVVVKEFKKILGPAPDAQDKDLVSSYDQLAKISQKAYEQIKNGSHGRKKEKVTQDDIELKLRLSQDFENARNLLQKSSFKAAFDLLTKIQSADPNFEKVRLYLIWAKIGLLPSEKKQQVIQELETEILQIPTEEKVDAIFSFVQGLIAKLKGDYPSAKKFFEKTIALESGLIVARRELNLLLTQSKKKTGLDSDLKEIVGSFFKRK